MRKITYAILMFLFCNLSFADTWHQGFLATCDKEKDEFKVEYHGDYDEDAIAEIYKKSKPFCELSDGKYELEPKFSFDDSPDGRGPCSEFEYAEIKILRNGKEIFKDFVSECEGSTSYISSVSVKPKESKKITVKRKTGQIYDAT